MAQYKQSARALTQMRRFIFSYDDAREAQADRVLAYLQRRRLRDVAAERAALPKGPYSGLTRGELRQTGTCETDWY